MDTRFDRTRCMRRIEDESVCKGLYAVTGSLAGERLSTFAELGEHLHTVAQRTLYVDLRQPGVFFADDDCGARDVLETRVFNPQFIYRLGLDLDCCGHILEAVVHQREPCLMFLDRCFTLTLERGIEQSELPSRGRPASYDSILPTIKVQVFSLVANVVKSGHAGADVEVHVCEKAMLSNVKANTDRARIAFPDCEIHIAHRRIKRAGICIYDTHRRGNRTREGDGRQRRSVRGPLHSPASPFSRSSAHEENHVGRTGLKSRDRKSTRLNS